MNKKIQTVVGIVWFLLGAALFSLGTAEVVDGFWSGIGTVLLVAGLLRILRVHRLWKNPKYREKAETDETDERIRFLRSKAWGWSGYIFVLIAAVSTVVLKIVGQQLLSVAAGCAACLMVALYWICWFVLKKKY